MPTEPENEGYATEQFSAETNAANHQISFDDRKGLTIRHFCDNSVRLDFQNSPTVKLYVR